MKAQRTWVLAPRNSPVSVFLWVPLNGDFMFTSEKIAIFVDGSNLDWTGKALSTKVDFAKLIQLLTRRNSYLSAVRYYTAVEDDRGNQVLRPMLDWMQSQGFTVIEKMAKTYTRSDGSRRVKGNMDIVMALDAVEMAVYVDRVILVTGDGDFKEVIDRIKAKCRKVTVVSTAKTSPPMVSSDLRKAANEFIDLADHITLISPSYEGA